MGHLQTVPAHGAQAAAAMKRFYRHNAGSSTSVDSHHHFIDHRNQSHSLSVNPNSPLTVRAMQGAPSLLRDGPAAQASPAYPEPSPALDMPEAPGHHDHTVSPRSYEPSNSSYVDQNMQNLMESTHGAGRKTPLENDVCFPLPAHADEPAQEGPRQSSDARAPPGYPYTFDLEALDAFVQEERERQNPSGSLPGMSFGSSGGGAGAAFGPAALPTPGLISNDASLYTRRPHRTSTGLLEGSGKYQRKLAMFEGGQSLGRLTEPSRMPVTGTSLGDDTSGRTPLKSASQTTYSGIDGLEKDVRGGQPVPPALPRAQTHPRAARPGVPIPGTAHDKPYRFTFYSNALPSTIHARQLHELPGPGQTFEDLLRGIPSEADQAKKEAKPATLLPGVPMLGNGHAESEPDSKTWWLDVMSPTDQEMRVLARTFGIHPLTTEDILMEETREKIELFRNYYLVCFRSFDQDPYSPTYLEPLNMYIIVFRDGTLSFHFRQTPHPRNVRRRIRQLKDYINVTSDWISYALIDDITDAFAPLIQSIEFEVDSIDELVLILKEAEQSDMLRRIGTCRKKVMGLLRLMGNKADVVKGLAKRSNEYWSVAPKSDIGMYLSDIQDHLITMTQNLNHYEMILSRSHSNYLAQISIEMTDANNQINDVLSKLTALGTVIVPMNVITGLWGMNVQVPGQSVENLNWFGGICTAMVIIAVSGYITTVRYLNGR